jgi:hypothetical protein
MTLPDPPPEEEPEEVNPADSILETTKQMIGIPPEDTAFDIDIIAGINSAFMSLNQVGVGPEEGFSISDNTALWDDFLDDLTLFGGLKNYVSMKVKLYFDPPGTSFAITSMEKLIEELEERMKLQVEILAAAEEEEIPEEEEE